MRLFNLSIIVLENIGIGPVQYARKGTSKASCVLTGRDPQSPRFDANHCDIVVAEGIEQPNCVRATAHASNEQVREPVLRFQDLPARLATDNRLEFAHDGRVWMGTKHRPEQVVSGIHMRDPVPNRLVDRIFESGAASINPAYLCAK